jgi:hypothetical protein
MLETGTLLEAGRAKVPCLPSAMDEDNARSGRLSASLFLGAPPRFWRTF